MKIRTEIPSEKFYAKNDYYSFHRVLVDGVTKASFHDGEPEDNSIGRNFNDVVLISSLMKLAYEAGKRGEELEIEEVLVDE